MFFQKKLDRAQKWLQGKNKDMEELPTAEELKEQNQGLPLEKGDLPLMILLGMGIILPVCLLVLLAICSFVFFL
ncbi:MAG: hypothetical protein SPI15_11900 [Candidatus Faecousia sp.]|nr:hypothetical protein [Clostridiales bacterium]MDY6181534.1 hypothetical protein [Candidatus Faecousia sp.]